MLAPLVACTAARLVYGSFVSEAAGCCGKLGLWFMEIWKLVDSLIAFLSVLV